LHVSLGIENKSHPGVRVYVLATELGIDVVCSAKFSEFADQAD
jgi:hypothetical protein